MRDALRNCIRGLIRTKTLTLVLFVSLALGTGANVAVYGVVDSLLMRPPAGVTGADRLVTVHTSQFSGASYGQSSYDDFLSLQQDDASFELAAAIDDGRFENVAAGGYSQQARVAEVSPAYFALLGMRQELGRLIVAEDAAKDVQPRVVVISHALWQSLGGDPLLIGRPVLLGAEEHTVIGVTPPRFRGLQLGRLTDVWTPIRAANASGGRGDRRFSIVARIQPAASLDDVQRRLTALAVALASAHPATNRGSLSGKEEPRRFTALPYSHLDPASRSNAANIAAVVVIASGLLLASGAVNAGTLLLSRVLAKRREIAVKAALGATRALLIREVMFEAIVIALGGAAIGLLFAYWTLDAIPALFAPDHAQMLDTHLRFSTVLATVALACSAGVLLGLAPAVQGTRSPAVSALRGDSGGVSDVYGGSMMRNVLAGAQVALSTILILATGLLVGSLRAALEADLGFVGRSVAVFTIKSPGLYDHPALGAAYQDSVLKAIAGLPEVRAAGWVSAPPLTRTGSKRFRLEAGSAAVADAVELEVNVASGGYFRAMGLPIIEGRNFSEVDGPRSERVAIVSDLLARRHFGASAVGHRLLEADGTAVEIVGVVPSGRYRTLQESPRPTVYYNASQEYGPVMTLVVRTRNDPASSLDTLTARLSAIDGRAEITRAVTLERHLSEAVAVDRMTVSLVGICGVLAMLMSSVGVYGVMNDTVRGRTREIGLRMALGASRPRVAQLVVAGAVTLTATGIAAGTYIAFIAGRIAGTIVHGVPHLEWTTIAVALVSIAAVVAFASVFPMRRALRISPTIALRG